MSSYLNTLALRSAEQPQPIRPRLTSLFEPAAALNIPSFKTTRTRILSRPKTVVTESDDDRPTTTAVMKTSGKIEAVRIEPEHQPKPDQFPNQSSRQLVPRPAITNKADSKLSKRKSAVEPETPVKIVDQPHRPAADRQDLPISDQPHSEIRVAHEVETRVIERLIQAESQPPSRPEIRSARPKPNGASLIVKPEVSADRAQAPDIGLEETETLSSIRVTIGRVDVRAIMPAAPPARPASSQAKEHRALSLEQYLKQRNGEIG